MCQSAVSLAWPLCAQFIKSADMRILFLSPTGQIGGAESSLISLISVLRDVRPAWSLGAILGSSGPLACKLEALKTDVMVLPFPPRLARFGESNSRDADSASRFQVNLAWAVSASVRYIHALRHRIRKWRPSVVHSNGTKMHALSIAAAARICPVVWHLHEFVSPRRVTSRILGSLANRVEAHFAVSQSVAVDANETLRLRRAPITLYSAIDSEVFSPLGPILDLDALAGLPPPAAPHFRIGIVSTFAHWKGHTTLIAALSRLISPIPFRAYIVGEAMYQTSGSQYTRHELESIVSSFGLGNCVGFTGYVSNPAAAFRALDLVVHASTKPEPFGLSIVEAMACGRVVVATNAGGASEIIQTGGAIGVPPGDPDVLASTLERLIRNPEERSQFVKRARAAALSLCARDRLGLEATKAYEQICPESLKSFASGAENSTLTEAQA